MRIVVVVLVVGLSATARADDDLAEARRLEAALEYEPALVMVERIIAKGGADRDKLVELHVLAGRLAGGLDRSAVAQDHFARALALAPATTLPDGTSPKITEPFDAARASTVPLRVTGAIDRGVATIDAQADPLRLVAGIAVELSDHRVVREPQGRRLDLPDESRAARLIALDAFGNEVWSQRVVETSTQRPPHHTRHTPFYKRALLWGSLTVVATGVASYAGWKFTRAQNEWHLLDDGMHDYSQLRDIELRGRRWGWTANIGFGVGAASALLTTWFAVAGRF